MYSPKLAEVLLVTVTLTSMSIAGVKARIPITCQGKNIGPATDGPPLKLMCESDTDEGKHITNWCLVWAMAVIALRPSHAAGELTPDDCTSPFGFS
ncbi:hypothetical protein PSHT_05637 [Puccinia striiformis]|uniref:Secreted protein n=1 Tax=Puccinia striiformis TaxID=27350 RepID=A0A2S4WA78_9BASI|nr:hypothetical protein PSHT_05637 [Puccinia striiformis]